MPHGVGDAHPPGTPGLTHFSCVSFAFSLLSALSFLSMDFRFCLHDIGLVIRFIFPKIILIDDESTMKKHAALYILYSKLELRWSGDIQCCKNGKETKNRYIDVSKRTNIFEVKTRLNALKIVNCVTSHVVGIKSKDQSLYVNNYHKDSSNQK